MIGNDIVDLNTATKESNWQRPGFLHKLFTERERVLIEDSVHPESTVWLLWSMKESAYKAWMQQGGKRFFGPKKFCCQLKADQSDGVLRGCLKGLVTIENAVFRTQSLFSKAYIYTWASKKDTDLGQKAYAQVFEVEKPLAKSETVHANLLAAYAEQERLSLEDLSLEKTSSGRPFLQYKNRKVNLSISLTHHGNYGAFAWLC